MHARVTTALIQPGTWDEGVAIIRDSILPAAQQQPGFKGLLSLGDRATGKFLSITLWESEAAMLASETGGYYQEQLAKVGRLLAGPPTREHFEVAVQA